MDKPLKVFVSSVQKELRVERKLVHDFIQDDPLLRRFFDVFLFEDTPAKDRRSDKVFLDEVDRSAIYLGLFAGAYGSEGLDGLSATEREFDRATEKGKCRLVYVKGSDDSGRDPRMLRLIRKAEKQLVRRRFDGVTDLTVQVYASLVQYLVDAHLIHDRPFDAAACPRATLADLSEEKVAGFLARAKRARDFALGPETPMQDALVHLNLLDEGQPSHAAVLLFGTQPQRFMTSAGVKCLHFHGTRVQKPIPSYQIYGGTVFEQVDRAVDFVMSKIARAVGTRAAGPQAPVTYELPREAVAEAIVNAVAHRDYSSNAGVQVMLFADRLEVWNPGALPPSLTPQLLRGPHESIPRNPLLARPLYLVRYIEMAGTGTLDMIAQCQNAALPEPDFEQRGGQWVVTIWRDWLTAEALAAAGLSERQKAVVAYVRQHGSITNRECRQLTGVTVRTATRDLAELARVNVLVKAGGTGRGAKYVLANPETGHKQDKQDTKPDMNRPQTRHKPDKETTKGPKRI